MSGGDRHRAGEDDGVDLLARVRVQRQRAYGIEARILDVGVRLVEQRIAAEVEADLVERDGRADGHTDPRLADADRGRDGADDGGDRGGILRVDIDVAAH